MQKTFNQNFILRKTNQKSLKSNVYLRITVNGTRTEFSIQRQCSTEKWNSAKGRLDGKTEDVKSFNKYLDAIELKIFEIFQSLASSCEDFDSEKIRIKYLGLDKEKPKMFLEVVDSHNEEFEKLVGHGYSFRTLQKYHTTKRFLSEFLKIEYGVADVKLNDVDYQMIKRFEIYLKTTKKCCHNTTIHYLKKVKKIVRECIAKNLISLNPFAGFRMSVEETHPVFLTEAEIAIIEKKEIAIERLRQVRDIFIFSCFTGLAYCDVSVLTKVNLVIGIDGDQWINTHRSKTRSYVAVPLLPVANRILLKYADYSLRHPSGKLLPTISNQKMNSYLKELAAICNIQKELTFHCARHTFATTVTLTNGVPIETVSKLLGHKSLKTTQHYARIVESKISRDMGNLKRKLASV